ncbi:MAG: homoserine/homoserine lactone efflux protein [Betaproteobacteria bacterium]|nr:homoserine/homoserine lactone efflux protein [Betaproteobacteria bacterium]
MNLDTWIALFFAGWLISISPGPGAISCLSTGLQHGLRRGRWNIYGLQAALAISIAIVATGLGALLATSSMAFSVVKWLGVAYLVYLGIRQWRAPDHLNLGAPSQPGTGSRWSLFRQGLLVNLVNPKGIVFFLAVLPQFIDPEAPQAPQYLIAAATLIAIDLVVMHGYTAAAASIQSWLRSPTQVRWINRSCGSLFVVAGLLLAGFQKAAKEG